MAPESSPWTPQKKAKYVVKVREKELIERLERLEKEWDIQKRSIMRDAKKNPLSYSLKDLLEIYPEIAKQHILFPLETVEEKTLNFLQDLHQLIMDWNLTELDENCTIPDILECAKVKQVKLLADLDI